MMGIVPRPVLRPRDDAEVKADPGLASFVQLVPVREVHAVEDEHLAHVDIVGAEVLSALTTLDPNGVRVPRPSNL